MSTLTPARGMDAVVLVPDFPVEEALFGRPPGQYWDRDGIEIDRKVWLRLVADADYRLLVITHLTRQMVGGPRITIRTEWAGEDLRTDLDPERRPLIWRTRVTGGALNGRTWLAARRPTAELLHDHAIGAVTEALTGRS